MDEEKIKAYIDLTIQRTMAEFKKAGLIKGADDAAYSDVSEILTEYYKGEAKDVKITYAIQGQRFDPYFRVIPLYYGDRKTIEQIAEELGVDTSTVMRNKKRLCLSIYNDIV